MAKPDTKETQTGKNTEKSKSVPERDGEGKSQADMLVNELLGNPVKKEEAQPKNPSLAKTENSRLSEPISGRQNKTAEGISNVYKPSPPNKPSVKKEIKEIQAARRQEAGKQGRDTQVKNMPGNSQKPLPHKQPSHKKTKKQSKAR